MAATKMKKSRPVRSAKPETDPGPLEGESWYLLVDMMHEFYYERKPGEPIGFCPVYKDMDDALKASDGRGQLIRITRRKE